ncbi:calcium channel protein [Mortierella polycephala]|uniref:Calcium-channel protein CCH1 n=1 Tax=Mortierella polycephala TaxID=41804 RepID=A0A9P6PN32_9FUNG|nr:calcium channel protein [Mortierella polycephala]
MSTIHAAQAPQVQVAESLEDSDQAQTSAVSSGQRYESLRDENQGLDNDTENDSSGLSPNTAAVGSAWARLARRESNQSSVRDEYELNPVNDRTGLTSNHPSFTAREGSQGDHLSRGDIGFNAHLEPPETQPRRMRGFHHKHRSNASADSSLQPKPARSTAPGSRLASMKQVLGRASTRVVNLNGSSRSQPPVPEISSIYSRHSSDDEEEQETRESHEDVHSTAADPSALKDAVRISRISLIPDTQESNPQPVLMDQQLPDPPLEGKTLFIFGPENPFRKRINRFLNQTWVELFLLLLLVVNLAFLIAKMSSPKGTDTMWGHWTDYGLLVIFVLYTIEIASRVIVSGLILYPKDGDKIRKLFGKKQRTDNLHDTNPTILRKASNAQKRQSTMAPTATFRQTDQVAPTRTAAATRATTLVDFAFGHKTAVTQYIPSSMDPLIAYKPQFVAAPGTQIPFLRHTFNRIDFIAVLCYWIDFALMMAGVHNVYIFKTIAAMRTLRLLNITSGSATILHSLKKSAPLLVNIVLFIAFFFIIFSIIGVQAFKGSMSRRCVLAADETEVLNQNCGGHYNLTDPTEESSYITMGGEISPTSPKGHICSFGYICKDIGANFDGAISFDVIYSAMVPVYVLMTGQTWTDLMYMIMDAEYAWSSIYFVLVVLVMNFWILNLFVAVINEMFAKIRDDSSHNSAFTSDSSTESSKNAILNESINNFTYAAAMFSRRKKWIEVLESIWVLAIVVDLVFQCLRGHNTPSSRLEQLDRIELWFTIAFGVDVIIRILVCLPTPSDFFKSRKNIVDLFLAVITLVIQIPPIRKSHVYVYLTVFQVVRIYRPIIYVERLRSLIQRVVGSWIGLLNLIFFIATFLGVVSVMAGILFREIITEDYESPMTFSDFYVSYLGMYQLFSGENWTDILYNVISGELPWTQIFTAIVFIIAFYSFANFVLVNMLIAIIMENFEGGAEMAKHTQQILDFAAKSGYSKEEERKFVIYLTKYLKPYPKSIGVDPLQTGWIHRMRKGLARQFLLGDTELFHGAEVDPLHKSPVDRKKNHHRRISSQKTDYDFAPFQGPLSQDEIDDTEHFRKLFAAHAQGYEEMDSPGDPITKKTPFFSTKALHQRSFLIFGPENKLRRFLQQFVSPGRGHRLHGKRENKMLSRPFNLFITLAILACVIVAAMTTPAWRLSEYGMAPEDQSLVVHISDYVFPAIFTVEFLIRAIADGFIFTPDAYLRTFWNKIDFFVLLTLYAPLVADITNSQGTSRFFRSLKALRALRLINQSEYIKGTFHAVLVAGFPQLFDATMLSMSLIVPFAIYGMRLFSGLFYGCNDTDESIASINDCVGTFSDDGFLKPRVWSNPSVYSFDNFLDSFLILFEIVSQEGWTGVMESARNVVGLGMQPRADASRYNAIFFVLYNLAGGYFVSALFVAIVIENYTKRTGTAFMTANQRRWMDLKKLLGGIKMSKARSVPPNNRLRQICHQFASPKRGWFARLLTIVTILNGVVLATEHVNSGEWEEIKNWVFLTLLSVYIMEIVFKIGGLGWNVYRKNWWNIYNGTVSICAFLITIMRVCGSSWQPLIQTQKLFLTAILFRLVPRSDSLNQLFMTMAASIGSISSLLGVWLVVFAVYGIMFVEIFGLTAYGPNGSDHVNFRNIGTSLLVMARMSTGEGWNDLMHDFAMEKPDCVNQPNNYLFSDCGSTAWAYALFISFNIISMYIFTNMFIVVVMHNFSYVYQIAPGFSLITREEIRGFKRAWAMIDKDHTGYIQKKDLARFLSSLRGVFDVRVYNEEHSLIKLQSRLETAKPNPVKLSARDLEKNAAAGSHSARKVLMLNETRRRSTFNMDVNGAKEKASDPGTYGKKSEPRANLLYKLDQDYNLAAFNSAIANLDKDQVKQRRRLYNFLYTEVVMSMEPIPGTESKKKKRFFHWRAGSLGGAGKNADGDYEMGEVGAEMMEAQQGISFQKMLTIMAHYKLIEDDQCLSIGDILRHRQKMDRIHAHINVTSVRSVLLKFVLRQRFLRYYGAVQRIRALAGETSSSGGSGNPPSDVNSAGPSSVGAGAGSIPSQHVPYVAHSSHSSISPEQSDSDGQRQVRINTGEDQDDSANAGSSSNASNPQKRTGRRSVIFDQGEKTALGEEESIDPAQANIMINNLRAEWQTFISKHSLSLTGDGNTSQIGAEPPRLPSLGDFDNVDLSGSTSGPGQQGGSTQQPRKEVLGFDYL